MASVHEPCEGSRHFIENGCTSERFLVNIFLTNTDITETRYHWKACRMTNIFKISSLSLTHTDGAMDDQSFEF